MEAFGKLTGGFTVCSKTMAFVPFGTIPTVTTSDSLHTELYKGGGRWQGGGGEGTCGIVANAVLMPSLEKCTA